MSNPSQDIRALEKRIEELEAQVIVPQLLTAKQVADMIGVHEAVFYDLKKRGDAPPSIYFSARTVRYDKADVLKWWDAKKVGAGA